MNSVIVSKFESGRQSGCVHFSLLCCMFCVFCFSVYAASVAIPNSNLLKDKLPHAVGKLKVLLCGQLFVLFSL